LQSASLKPADEITGSDAVQRGYRNLIHGYSFWENVPTSSLRPVFRQVEGILS